MSKSIVHLAVAGAGKTYHICHHLNPAKRNLLLSFTNQNISNICRELTDAFGEVPKYTKSLTFDSFLLDYFIWPYLPAVLEVFFHQRGAFSRTVDLRELPFDKNKLWLQSKNNLNHYFVKASDGTYGIRLCNVAELIMNKNFHFNDGTGLFELGMRRVNYFYDSVYIDEFQDYRNSRYDLMLELIKEVSHGELFGDYYQHSVSGQNNSGRPFGVHSTYETFKKELEKKGFEIDETTLRMTRRCSEDVCAYIRNNLGIAIKADSSMNREGSVINVLQASKLKSLIVAENPQILSLKTSQIWNGLTFGLSKGNTYSSTVVVIPDVNWRGDSLKWPSDGISKNKLYVALTRSTGNVYLTKTEIMNEAFS